VGMGVDVLCASEQNMAEFEINHLERKGTIGNYVIQKLGTYTVTITFEKPNSYFPTSVSKTFEVVE
jgi:ABC-type transport system substrate-binding protein